MTRRWQAHHLTDLRDRIKNLVTAPTLVVRPKYRDALIKKNYVNLVITTNEALDAVALDAADRRFVCYRCAEPRRADYFAHLCGVLADDRAPRVIYDWLMARPVEQLRARRPRTEFYKHCLRQSISPLGRFMSAVVNARAYNSSSVGAMVRVGQLHYDYMRYVRDMGLEDADRTRPAFTSALALMFRDEALMKRVFAGGFAYVLDFARLRATLQAASEYDEQAAFDGLVQPGPSAWEAQDVARFRRESRRDRASESDGRRSGSPAEPPRGAEG